MRRRFLARFVLAASLVWLAGTRAAPGAVAATLKVKVLAEGLQEPHGVALHPVTGDIYVAEKASGQIKVLKAGGAPAPALAPGWTVSTNLPRWAYSAQMPREKWMAAALQKPGPLSISSNGTLYVSEQEPNGRILAFSANAAGQYAEAIGVPVPWLDQEFQWRDIQADRGERLYIVGADEVGSDFMKFGSALVREPNGDWWVIDFGPFANFCTFTISDRQDVMLLGDRNKGTLSWWEVNRHIMLGGSPDAAGRTELKSLAIYPDGSFILGVQTEPGKAALKLMEPFSGQQKVLSEEFKSIGDIEMDRTNGRYLVTDPVAGRLLECTFEPPLKFNEVTMRQMVRAVEGMMGLPSEAPAFLNTFMERLQTAASDLLPDDATHAVQFNLSDIAGKMPIIAGRVRAAIEVEGAEDDPLETIEFFLLFPSKVVLTETAVSPSLSFFSARRKSGAVEQTRSVFTNDVGVYRLSGTNISKIATGQGGLQIPVVACGMEQADGGVYVNLSFLGSGVYEDYYLTLFQGGREQRAKLVVRSKDSASGMVTYDASFMEEATIEGMDGKITREQLSNLLISGFQGGGEANRSVGWLRLGQFPASQTVAFGDAGETQMTGAASGLKETLDKKRVDMNLENAAEIQTEGGAEPAPGAPAEAAPAAAAAPEGTAP